MSIGENIKAAREAAEMSQADLADKVGVSVSTVSGWEAGTHGVRMARFPAIAETLNTTVEKLVRAA